MAKTAVLETRVPSWILRPQLGFRCIIEDKRLKETAKNFLLPSNINPFDNSRDFDGQLSSFKRSAMSVTTGMGATAIFVGLLQND